MTARFFDIIDWTRPWLAPFLPAAQSVLYDGNWCEQLNRAAAQARLHNHRGLPIRFVPQSELPAGTAYEAFISATGCVPTRANLHDFLNALVWLTFPGIKVRLNALQAAEISRAPQAQTPRGKIRDAATIFDENAALLVTRSSDLIDALRAHHWQEAFMARRAEFESVCEVWLFGHALMEKLVAPYKAITAHALPVVAEPGYFSLSDRGKTEWLDQTVARHLSKGLATSELTPLPVLGVPGWWPGQTREFYADTTVFRGKRSVGE
ncbi:MAG: hypothetical protein JWR25_1298 [Noviherbaspirillum sp.]|nr:hypothetical protein [Noviherbaspirillum sp.]